MAAMIKKFGKKMRRASRAALQSQHACSGRSRARSTGIRVVKAASAERFERRRYRADHGQARRRAAPHEPDRRVHHADAGDAHAAASSARSCCSPRTWCSMHATRSTRASFLLSWRAWSASRESLRRVSKVNNVLAAAPTPRPRASSRCSTCRSSAASRRRSTSPHQAAADPARGPVRERHVQLPEHAGHRAVIDVTLVVPQGPVVASSAATAPARRRCSRCSRGSTTRSRAAC